MMVTFVSQCEKKALSRTRRVLDAFANRIGDNTWQTIITEDGLIAVKQLLRKTVTKNTAVSCHWIRSRSRSELVWIVGNRNKFSKEGFVPVNSTKKNFLSTDHQSSWHNAEMLTLVTRIAALFHDFGKANDFFIEKLKKRQTIADPYRHEWISLRLFEAFVLHHTASDTSPTDTAWLTALAEKNTDLTWLLPINEDNTNAPLANLPPLAQLVGWLVVTHHRLPIRSDFLIKASSDTNLKKDCLNFSGILQELKANWCYPKHDAKADEKIKCCKVQQQNLPIRSHKWQSEASRCASRLLSYTQQNAIVANLQSPLQDSYLSHIGRLILMLADHHYSSGEANAKQHDESYYCYANTDKDGKPKQFLDDHLIGVNQGVRQLMGVIPRLNALLPAFEPEHQTQKQLESKTSTAYYQWQDKAYALAVKHQADSVECGFFGVNLASTGRGKTLANARIMYGLADPERGARFNVAMGLRTLTLQTGQAYRQRLGLTNADLAILVGGGAVRELFEQQQSTNKLEDEKDPQYNPSLAERMGSESFSEVIDKNLFVDFDDNLSLDDKLSADHILPQWLNKHADVKKMLIAPILCCTIDHLMPATESTRGGRQIAPMLRLMSSDLVLDEPDDFSPEDWYALARLVYWAGLLGSRVLLSSATLTPAEVNGLFMAYQQGRIAYNQNRRSNVPKEIVCGWFDENDCQIKKITLQTATEIAHSHNVAFSKEHVIFTKKRAEFLANESQRRKLAFVSMGEPTPSVKWSTTVSEKLHDTVQKAHQLNAQTDPLTQKKYSVGLMRFANIDALAEVAEKIIKLPPSPDTRLHVCVYHSRFPLLARANLEQQLDELLNRNNNKAPHDVAFVRGWLNQYPEQHHIIVVIASPVAEVGRDHDYDWIIVEPSSMRSIIQVVGRVRRHRREPYEQPNVFLMETNIRHLKNPDGVAFSRPGFETAFSFKPQSHFLPDLLSDEQKQRLDSTARIRPRPNFEYGNFIYLADLEHERMMQLMLNRSLQQGQETKLKAENNLPVARFWQNTMQHTGLMQQYTRFRKSTPEALMCFKSADDNDTLQLHEFEPKTGTWIKQNSQISPITLKPHQQVSLWPQANPVTLLQKQLNHTPQTSWPFLCTRYLSLSLPTKKDGSGAMQYWKYEDWIGFVRA